MTTLTPAQIVALVLQAGFKSTAALDAVSVALAESNGRTDVVRTNHDRWRSRDRGLFQINSHWHSEVSDSAAFDPKQATAAAYRISKGGTDWRAWSTWPVAAAAERPRATIGLQQYLHSLLNNGQGGMTLNPFDAGTLQSPSAALQDLKNAPGTFVAPLKGALSVGESVAQIAVILAHAGAWMADPHNWLRIVMVTAGAGGIIVALVLLADSGAAGSTAQSVARTTTDAGKKAAMTAALA